jgi:recombination protein RecA
MFILVIGSDTRADNYLYGLADVIRLVRVDFANRGVTVLEIPRGPVKEREAVIGNHVRVKVVKNKVAPPFRQAEFDIMFDEGISHTSLLVDLASEANIIQKSGAWYSYNDQRIGQGRENAKLFLRDNPPLMTEIEAKVKELLGVRPVGAAASEE